MILHDFANNSQTLEVGVGTIDYGENSVDFITFETFADKGEVVYLSNDDVRKLIKELKSLLEDL